MTYKIYSKKILKAPVELYDHSLVLLSKMPGLFYSKNNVAKCSRCRKAIYKDVLRFQIKMNYTNQFRLCPRCLVEIGRMMENEIPKQEAWEIKQISELI
jgi:hypothetical protein